MSGLRKEILYSTKVITPGQLRDVDSESYVLGNLDLARYQQIEEWCKKYDITAMMQSDQNYHYKFTQIASAPFVVYLWGNKDILNKDILAIVGPRTMTNYAQEVMGELFSRTRSYDIVTVSGLADGVDIACHQLSMDHHVPTIAVLGGGIRCFLQSSKRQILHDIVQHGGLVISEFPLDKKPERYTFPQRNRIIAGLSDCLFLPEAGEKSGSLITVDFALKMHKTIYGAPNTIFSKNSAGLHQSMQSGHIIPVIDFDSMLNEHFNKKEDPEIQSSTEMLGQYSLNEQNKDILTVLEKNPAGQHVDELIQQTGLSTQEVMAQLSMAEVFGQVMQDEGIWKMKGR